MSAYIDPVTQSQRTAALGKSLESQFTLSSQQAVVGTVPDDTESSLSSVVPSSVPTRLQRVSDFASNIAEAGDVPLEQIKNRWDYSWVDFDGCIHLAGFSKLL